MYGAAIVPNERKLIRIGNTRIVLDTLSVITKYKMKSKKSEKNIPPPSKKATKKKLCAPIPIKLTELPKPKPKRSAIKSMLGTLSINTEIKLNLLAKLASDESFEIIQ